MALKERIAAEMKAALLSGNRFVGETLRGLKAAILDEEVSTGRRDEGLSDTEIEKIAQEGARNHGLLNMAVGDFFTTKLVIPVSKPEQEKIADFLMAVDERIAVGEKKLELLETYKRGVMQKIFSQQIRFKDENGNPYPDWEEKKLGEVSKIKTGDSDVQDAVADGDYPFFIRSKEVKRSNKYIYDGEAILIPGEGGIGEIFHYINGKFNYHQRVYKISDFDAKTHGKYVLYFIHQNFARQANKHSVKATVDSLRLPTFTDFSVSLPCKEEQQKIATFLTALDDKIKAEQTRLTAAKQWKKGLLQRMFV
jgi:type I restriction enzyme S subunit